ncbi:RDD family protein [uncultured Thiodictyon sp.]|uniref:RDD family protein n=1 Tax=uncultured Thiodictyon sp. TaxID=1846217 RepID=UPI003457C2BB
MSVAVKVSIDAPTPPPLPPPKAPVPSPEATPQVPRLPRRLGALLYDSILLFALLLLATALLIIPYDLLAARPYPQGEWLYRTLFQAYLLAVIVGFYVYFWTHGGQTLGMSAWRLRVLRDDGGRLSARDALRRLAWAALSLAPVGLGLWWCLFDREHLAWHDRRSRTRLVVVPRGG